MTRSMRTGASLLIFVFGGLSALAAIPTCPVGYAQPRSYDRGNALRVAVDVADFDGDGLPDIASLHRSGDDGTVNRTGTLLLNRGHGAFDSKPIIAPGDFSTLRAGFLNNLDKYPDLLLGGTTGLTILRGGPGGIEFGGSYDIPNVTSIALGQFDGFGAVDIAVTQSAPAALTILTANIDGSYSIGSSIPLTAKGVAVVSADFDGDGKIDLAVADEKVVTPYFGNGNGTFTPGSPIANVPPASLAVGDIDRDGHPDIVIGGKNSLTIFVYAGGRSFRLNGISGLNGDANSTTVTDLDHDSNPDVVVVGTGDVAVFLGTPGGRFLPPVIYAGGADPEFGTAADFDLDGFNDVVVANAGSADVSILKNMGGGKLDAMRQLEPNEGAIALAVTDVDQEGPPDLIVATNGTNEVRLFKPSGSWFEPFGGNQLGFTPRLMVTGDVNGDARADIALLSADDKTIGILPSVQGGTFEAPTLLTFGIELCCIALADLDHDGKDDLIYANKTGTLTVRFALSGTTFGPAHNYTLPDPATAIAVGDFDLDGNKDVAVSTAIQLFVLNGLPGGDLSLTTVIDILGINLLQVGFVSDDIFPDIVAAGSDVAVIYNNQGAFTSQVHLTLPTEKATSIAIADLDNDGKSDLAVTSSGTASTFNYLSIYTQRPDGGFDSQPAIETEAKPEAVVAQDFDGDGHPEVVIAAGGKTFVSHWRCATPAVTLGVPRGIQPGQPATFVANIVNGTADGATYTFMVDGNVAAAVSGNPNEPGVARANLTLTPGSHIVSVIVRYKEGAAASSDPITVMAGAGKQRAVRH